MKPVRASGILLHPTCLPAPRGDDGTLLDAGSGDFGASAFHFVDWLAAAGQTFWQVLPFNPVGPGQSPYTSVSAHAGSPWLVSPVELMRAGWLADDALRSGLASLRTPSPNEYRVDFAASGRVRMQLLRTAAQNFFHAGLNAGAARERFEAWCAGEEAWLDDYALFMAIRAERGGDLPWAQWPHELAHRTPAALRAAAIHLAPEVRFWCFVQWVFSEQWQAVRDYARVRGVRVVGDMPIYVAWDSADVWADAHLFALDADMRPAVVAGVPPDYFSATGQLWGNPLYRWDRHLAEDFAWWKARLRSALRHADLVRIDHFRGFAAYWEVPADAATAITGSWRAGPGMALFTALERDLEVAPGTLPVIAEDLGTITPEVRALLASTGLPGMRVLQFAFGAQTDDLNLPHNIPECAVVYTGTHDNNTSPGWFAAASPREQHFARTYLKTDGQAMGRELVHTASATCARYAIYPLQDVLGLGAEARMNIPGIADGQWNWRFSWAQVEPWHARWLREISAVHGRNGLPLAFAD
jgi:4-alpha-glucanotransferase